MQLREVIRAAVRAAIKEAIREAIGHLTCRVYVHAHASSRRGAVSSTRVRGAISTSRSEIVELTGRCQNAYRYGPSRTLTTLSTSESRQRQSVTTCGGASYASEGAGGGGAPFGLAAAATAAAADDDDDNDDDDRCAAGGAAKVARVSPDLSKARQLSELAQGRAALSSPVFESQMSTSSPAAPSAEAGAAVATRRPAGCTLSARTAARWPHRCCWREEADECTIPSAPHAYTTSLPFTAPRPA
jgi:hypothetical protein